MTASKQGEILQPRECRLTEAVLRFMLNLPKRHPYMGTRQAHLDGMSRVELMQQLSAHYSTPVTEVENLLLESGAI
jgi:hypothetical protein